MMYSSITMYRLHRDSVANFLQIQQEAAEIYKHYGAHDDETFAPANLSAKYGCMAFTEALELNEGEVLYIGISRFKDKAHHDEVMAKVDTDERIGQLFEKITSILEVSRLVRGEFERKV